MDTDLETFINNSLLGNNNIYGILFDNFKELNEHNINKLLRNPKVVDFINDITPQGPYYIKGGRHRRKSHKWRPRRTRKTRRS
jgi:hypothetical protein